MKVPEAAASGTFYSRQLADGLFKIALKQGIMKALSAAALQILL